MADEVENTGSEDTAHRAAATREADRVAAEGIGAIGLKRGGIAGRVSLISIGEESVAIRTEQRARSLRFQVRESHRVDALVRAVNQNGGCFA
jgi:hypothetical protein